MVPDENVVSEPETVQDAPVTSEAPLTAQGTAPSESAPDASGEASEASGEQDSEPDTQDTQDTQDAPEGHSWVPVHRETLAQVAERLHKPVNVVADANPDTTNKETGEITSDRLAVPDETTA